LSNVGAIPTTRWVEIPAALPYVASAPNAKTPPSPANSRNPCTVRLRIETGSTGAMAADPGDAGPAPFALRANTLHVYVRSFVMPVTVKGDRDPVALAVLPPLLDRQTAV
jgi:hypothetical protein